MDACRSALVRMRACVASKPVRDDVAAVGCELAETLVGTVRVVVLDVLVQVLRGLPAVPDEGAVEEFATHGGDGTAITNLEQREHDRKPDGSPEDQDPAKHLR
jgi:hypothetical protein